MDYPQFEHLLPTIFPPAPHLSRSRPGTCPNRSAFAAKIAGLSANWVADSRFWCMDYPQFEHLLPTIFPPATHLSRPSSEMCLNRNPLDAKLAGLSASWVVDSRFWDMDYPQFDHLLPAIFSPAPHLSRSRPGTCPNRNAFTAKIAGLSANCVADSRFRGMDYPQFDHSLPASADPCPGTCPNRNAFTAKIAGLSANCVADSRFRGMDYPQFDHSLPASADPSSKMCLNRNPLDAKLAGLSASWVVDSRFRDMDYPQFDHSLPTSADPCPIMRLSPINRLLYRPPSIHLVLRRLKRLVCRRRSYQKKGARLTAGCPF